MASPGGPSGCPPLPGGGQQSDNSKTRFPDRRSSTERCPVACPRLAPRSASSNPKPPGGHNFTLPPTPSASLKLLPPFCCVPRGARGRFKGANGCRPQRVRYQGAVLWLCPLAERRRSQARTHPPTPPPRGKPSLASTPSKWAVKSGMEIAHRPLARLEEPFPCRRSAPRCMSPRRRKGSAWRPTCRDAAGPGPVRAF